MDDIASAKKGSSFYNNINKCYYNVNWIMIMFYSAHIDVIDLKFLIGFK